jgi:DNA invertase Pin-like site-specific DNA recombinase
MARLCPSPEAKQRFTDIYDCLMVGKSYAEIGKIYNISKQRVHQIIRHFATSKQYAEIRQRIEQRASSTFLGPEVLIQLDEGHTCNAISKNLGCSVSFVKRISSKRNKKIEHMS